MEFEVGFKIVFVTECDLFFRWSPSLRLAGESGQLSDFIDGLGPGQLVGRQVLGAPSLGDIQLSMCYQKGYLEVEVIRARGLQARPGSKVLPGKGIEERGRSLRIDDCFCCSTLCKSVSS